MARIEIAALEGALLAALRQAPELGYIGDRNIVSVSRREVDFDKSQVIAIPPALLVVFIGAVPEDRTTTGHRYTMTWRFAIGAVSENLRGLDAARKGAAGKKGAYQMVDDVMNVLAGRTLETAAGRAHVWLRGVALNDLQASRAVYNIEIEARAAWDNN